jgi:putative glycosyltransferase (TIGR04372 family)
MITIQIIGSQIQKGITTTFFRKLKLLLTNSTKPFIYFLATIALFVIRLIKPLLLIRIGSLNSFRIGHFAANTEIYLCERKAGINLPNQPHIDIFYLAYEPVCNQQLMTMWKRLLLIWPNWLIKPLDRLNRLFPGGNIHQIGHNTQHDRDVHNLFEKFLPHLQFTDEEEAYGKAGLREIGIPEGRPFICLNVRDNAYLDGKDWAYHNYRNSDVQNYILAAEALSDQGFYVIRMGAKVNASINTTNPRIIDYATNGMRNDFMDVYLGARCQFAISTQTGWDCIPYIFRRPICYVNVLPIGYAYTFSKNCLFLTKRHNLKVSMSELTCAEVFSFDLGFSLSSSDYEGKGVVLSENSPEEIRGIVLEMVERMNGIWQSHPDDENLQQRFWQIFPTDAVDACSGMPLHGKIYARYGSKFLRDNKFWLQ